MQFGYAQGTNMLEISTVITWFAKITEMKPQHRVEENSTEFAAKVTHLACIAMSFITGFSVFCQSSSAAGVY